MKKSNLPPVDDAGSPVARRGFPFPDAFVRICNLTPAWLSVISFGYRCLAVTRRNDRHEHPTSVTSTRASRQRKVMRVTRFARELH